jgi:hypothetical protein
VEFIHEQDDTAGGFFDITDDGFEAFFKLTAEFCAGYK